MDTEFDYMNFPHSNDKSQTNDVCPINCMPFFGFFITPVDSRQALASCLLLDIETLVSYKMTLDTKLDTKSDFE